MATLQTDEANIIDAEEFNWRIVVYPLLLVLLVVAAGFGYYYYQQNAIDTAEAQARAALIKATTPAEFLKVAADYPTTDQAMLATLSAANASFDQQDYDGALSAYNKVINNPTVSAQWHDTAQLGIGSCYEAKGDTDKAIATYLEVARRGDDSAFAPYAYNCVARIYDEKGDRDTERAILGQAKNLDQSSPFTRMAINKLNELAPQAPPISLPLNGASNPLPPSAPAAPAPTAPIPPAH